MERKKKIPKENQMKNPEVKKKVLQKKIPNKMKQ